MPRQIHTSGRRLKESKLLILVAELLKRGARTKTVERLTGLTEVPIRDVFREMFGVSPQKGPSGYSHTHFTSTQLAQFDASLAQVCIEAVYQARANQEQPATSPELGYLYCSAYDYYLSNVAPLKTLITPMVFERFAHLASILSKRSVLSVRSCLRCNAPFVAPTSPGFANQRKCPYCRITTARGCARCSTYVALDIGGVSPRRRPMCDKHTAKHRPITHMLRQYRESTADDVEAAVTPEPGQAVLAE